MKFNINLNNDFNIKISSHTIQVKFVSPEHEVLKPTEEHELCHGVYIAEEFTIYIRKTDPETMKLSTFFHEMFHVLEHIFTFELDHKELNLVAECLTQTMLDNFKVIK